MPAIAFDVLGNFAFVLTTIAYTVKDIVWLRTLSILSSLTWITYLFTRTEVLWISVFWNCVFISVNAVRIVLLYRESRSIRLSPEERSLRDTLFPQLSLVDFARLVSAGRWVRLEPGTVIIEQGKPVRDVLLVCEGAAAVEIDGAPVRHTSGLEFLGEVSFLTHDVASATVRAAVPMRAIAWPHDALRTLLRESLAIRFALRSVMSGDLARKLKESGPKTIGGPTPPRPPT
jgi:hypothetical protein